MRDLHLHPPVTMAHVSRRHPWVLPALAVVFVALAIGAVAGWLVWDQPITAWVVEQRSHGPNAIFRRISFLGSTRVVFVVSAVAALVAWRRCPRLALAIVVIALARPLAEFVLKELISRPRPAGDRMVNGEGYSFPSGHPLATAASWGLIPLVVGLYTRRRALWWSVAVAVWTLAVGVAASRVWLGVHWTSDVVAGLLLAVLGVAAAERFISATHGSCPSDRAEAHGVDADVVDRPVLEATS